MGSSPRVLPASRKADWLNAKGGSRLVASRSKPWARLIVCVPTLVHPASIDPILTLLRNMQNTTPTQPEFGTVVVSARGRLVTVSLGAKLHLASSPLRHGCGRRVSRNLGRQHYCCHPKVTWNRFRFKRHMDISCLPREEGLTCYLKSD